MNQDIDILVGYLSIPNSYTILQPTFPYWEGSYEVTPATYQQKELNVKNKSMKQNLKVQKIPQFIVSNDQGGATLIIGEEYYQEV